jgi:hypothetical protein
MTKTQPFLCVYCQKGHVKKLPAQCPNCKRSLKLAIKRDTPLVKVADRYFRNGLRLNVTAEPGKGEIMFRAVKESQNHRIHKR